MPSPENIQLRLARADEERVREIFEELAGQGHPRQQQTPHVTITFAHTMEQAAVRRAAQLLPAVVPAPLHRVGTVTFGIKRKQTVAWLLETTEELERAAREISTLNPEGRGHRWIPHLTMGLRLPKEIVPDYIRALEKATSNHFKTLSAETAVFWQPQAGRLTRLDTGQVE